MKRGLIIWALSTTLVMGCSSNKTEIEVPEPSAAEQLSSITRSYFDDGLALNPLMATFVGASQYNGQFNAPIGEASLAQQKAYYRKYLDLLAVIDADSLHGQDWLNYAILKSSLQHDLQGFQFHGELMPIDQFGGVPSYFASLGSGQSAQPFNTAQDYDNFMRRAQGFAVYMRSTIAAMQEGVTKGIVLPKVLVKKVLPQLQAQIVDDPTQSLFYGPVAALDENDGISAQDKARIKPQYINMIERVIIPSYQRVYQYMATDYLKNARDTVGLSALPNGKAWYEYMIKTHTTLPLTATALHEYGLSEVARILDEMKQVKAQVGFNGDLAAFFEYLRIDDRFFFDNEQAVIDAYTNIKADIDRRLPTLFSVFPKADYVVKPVEAYRAQSAAGASYMPPAVDGSRPGIFYINTYNLKAQPKYLMETLSVHEAAPGHHFQIAIQQEVEGMPRFRKFGGYTVFAEGWALYAESLGKELGLFSDPYMWYGRLSDEQLRAMRLVVDTGLHAFGWSREQAIEYMLANSSMAESDVIAEVERYIAMPGQALAYKSGERHIRGLREKAKAALGDKFDIKAFHRQILIDGSMPMPILSEKINHWIAETK